MTEREEAKKLIDELPENRLPYVIGFMLGIIAICGMEKHKENTEENKKAGINPAF